MAAAYIFCPSQALNREKINIPENHGDIYIAADSGITTAFEFNITPDVLIGDCDSIQTKNIILPEDNNGIKIIKYPAEKSDTDLMLAVKYALGLGYKSIIIIGGLDGRTDHTLANLFYLKYIKINGGDGCITNGYNKITFISNGIAQIYKNYKYISVIPVSPELRGVTLTGFRYPLKNACVRFEEPYTISNEISDGLEFGIIEITEGEALICECDDVL